MFKIKWKPYNDVVDKSAQEVSNFAKDPVKYVNKKISDNWNATTDTFTSIAKVFGIKQMGDRLFSFDLPPDQGYQVQSQFETSKALPLVFGKVKAAGNVIDKQVSSDYKYLHVIYAIAISETGRRPNVNEIFIDGQSGDDSKHIWANGLTQTGTRFDGKYLISVHDGFGDWTTPQNSGMTSVDNATMRYNEMLCVYIRYEYDREIWQGEPTPYFIIQSPVQETPAQALKYFIENVRYGASIPSSLVNADSFNYVSSICSQIVSSPTGNRERFTLNTLIDGKTSTTDNISKMLSIFGGSLVFKEGQYHLSIEQAGDATVTITESDIIGSVVQGIGDLSSLKNRFTVSFTDADFNYKTNTAEYDDLDIRNSRDGGIVLSEQATIPGINNMYEALALAEKSLKKSYYTKSVKVKTSWEIDVSVGDIVGLTVEQFGYANKEFRVTEKAFNLNGTIEYTLIEHYDSVYTTSSQNLQPSAGTFTYPNPWVRLPAPTNVVITEKDDYRTGVADISFDVLTGDNSALVDTYVVKITSQTAANKVYVFESLSSPIYVNVEPDTYSLEVYAISDLQIEGNHSPAQTWAVKNDYQYTPPPAVINLSIAETLTFSERYPVSVVTLTWDDNAEVTVPLQYEVFQQVKETYISKGVTNEHFMTLELASLDFRGQTLSFVVQAISYGQQKLSIAESTSASVAIVGDTGKPHAPIEFDIDVLSDTAEAIWRPHKDDIDIDYFIIRYNKLTDTAAITWENSIPFITHISHQSRVKKFGTRLGSYLIKTVDTSGNISDKYKIAATTVPKAESLNLVKTIDDSQATPVWPGSKSGFIVNIDDHLETTTNSAIYTFLDNVDLGDIYTVRITSMIGIETTSTTADVGVYVSYTDIVINFNTDYPDIHSVANVHDIGTGWTSYRKVSVGEFTGRIFRFQIRCVKTDDDILYITSDKIDIDMPERRESVYNIAVASGGTSISFVNGFYEIPYIGVTISGMSQGDNYVISSPTKDGFTINIYDSANAGKAGIVDYQAVGYGRINSEVL